MTLHHTCRIKLEWRCFVLHSILGTGSPMTWHSNVRFPPSLMVSTGALMDTSGTPEKQATGVGDVMDQDTNASFPPNTCTYCSSPSQSCRAERCCRRPCSSVGRRCRLALSSATAVARTGHTSKREGYPSEPWERKGCFIPGLIRDTLEEPDWLEQVMKMEIQED